MKSGSYQNIRRILLHESLPHDNISVDTSFKPVRISKLKAHYMPFILLHEPHPPGNFKADVSFTSVRISKLSTQRIRQLLLYEAHPPRNLNVHVFSPIYLPQCKVLCRPYQGSRCEQGVK